MYKMFSLAHYYRTKYRFCIATWGFWLVSARTDRGDNILAKAGKEQGKVSRSQHHVPTSSSREWPIPPPPTP